MCSRDRLTFFSLSLPLLQFNQDLYPSTAGVPIGASTSTSTSSHSPCSPLLPPSLPSATSTSTSAHSHSLGHSSILPPSSIPLGSLGSLGSLGQRHLAKEEDLSLPRNETEGNATSDQSSASSCARRDLKRAVWPPPREEFAANELLMY